MNPQINTIFSETIQLEIKTGELYHLMWRLFPDDNIFWACLCAHIECHVSKLTGAKDSFFEEKIVPSIRIDSDGEYIQKTIGKINGALEEYQRVPPTKMKALTSSLEIELRLREIYYNIADNLPLNTVVIEFLGDIIEENKFHVVTIQKMLENPSNVPTPAIKSIAASEWNQNLSVDISEINEQHNKLISMINGLNDAVQSGIGKQVLAMLLNGFINYFAVLFKTEENFMGHYHFPGLQSHCMEHRRFIKQVENFKGMFELELDPMILSMDILSFLKEWVQYHVFITDKEYGPFLYKMSVRKAI